MVTYHRIKGDGARWCEQSYTRELYCKDCHNNTSEWNKWTAREAAGSLSTSLFFPAGTVRGNGLPSYWFPNTEYLKLGIHVAET